jgi:hypothetical protein
MRVELTGKMGLAVFIFFGWEKSEAGGEGGSQGKDCQRAGSKGRSLVYTQPFWRTLKGKLQFD